MERDLNDVIIRLARVEDGLARISDALGRINGLRERNASDMHDVELKLATITERIEAIVDLVERHEDRLFRLETETIPYLREETAGLISRMGIVVGLLSVCSAAALTGIFKFLGDYLLKR